MTYDYKCDECKAVWEDAFPTKDRDRPLAEPCPHCGVEGKITRPMCLPGIQYDGVKPLQKRAHPDLRERLKSMKDTFGYSRKGCTIQYD